MSNILFYMIFAMLSILFVVVIFMIIGWRWIIKRIVKKFGTIVFTDSYQENIMELMPGLRHMGIQNMLENSLRAESGDLVHRPLGSSKKWPHLDPITFIPAQVSPFPVASEVEVDMNVTIGPKAKKPMEHKNPTYISGMAYGIDK